MLGDILGVSKRLTLLGGNVDFDTADGVVVAGEDEGAFLLAAGVGVGLVLSNERLDSLAF